MMHDRAIDLLSQQLLRWYKQIQEMRAQNLQDAVARETQTRAMCHEVEESVAALEELQPKTLRGQESEEKTYPQMNTDKHR